MADACLQEVILDRPLHQIVIDGLTTDALVVVDGLVVVRLQGGQVCHFQEMFVCETA